ncbi:hypothetical protein COLO4_23514 [Corchorus olitorius]|uniref:Uncharacterized protein n=1 Tax=Corchorus olitorius TaxID=93759 RepID=A0A1R3IG72_9ROSI|nr:hypothetical protein COLO4_23514 [Corchorus olitorius]
MILKQTARTHIKLALMFGILKAREGGDSAKAATLTHFLRFQPKKTWKERAAGRLEVCFGATLA